MENDLKPCPFCGAPGIWDQVNGHTAVACSNDDCDASFQIYESRTWNTRATQPVDEAELRRTIEKCPLAIGKDGKSFTIHTFSPHGARVVAVELLTKYTITKRG